MSTRSMTCFAAEGRQPKHREAMVCTYRHCDGYPAEAGASLLEALADAPDKETALARLLGMRYEATSYGAPSRPIYEAANWQPQRQGDLEHVYVCWRDYNSQNWYVRHYARGSYVLRGDQYHTWPAATYTAAEFVGVVNRDRQEINRRIAELRRDQPGAFGDAADYPMLLETSASTCDHCGKPNASCPACDGLVTCHEQCPRCGGAVVRS